MVCYKLMKTTIAAACMAKIIINVLMRYQGLSKSIIRDQDSSFTSNLLFLLFYFLGIKQKLSTAFGFQTKGKTDQHNGGLFRYFC